MAKSTSLADAITSHVNPRGSRCLVALVRGQLKPADLADLDAALVNPAVPGTAIAKAVTHRGHKLPSLSVQRHRRGECNCGR